MSLRSIALVIIFVLVNFLGGHAQVTLQTGGAVFSLPMFNWQDDKSRLTTMVALGYNSGSGLRVNDVASNEGQGWNLVAGGVITRMQVGEPDDQPAWPTNGPGNDLDRTRYPPGYLYAGIPASQGCPNALTRYPIFGSKNQIYTQHNSVGEDRQLDYFSFQFNGKSGLFILNTSDGDQGVSLGDSKMKITFQRDNTMTQNQGIRTTITSFQIQDVDGLIYKFANHGLTKVLQSSFSDATGTHKQSQPKISDGGVYHQSIFDVGPTAAPWVNSEIANPYVINNWYLTEIDEPLTGRKIQFTYYTRNLNNPIGADIIYNNSSDRYVVISHKRSISTELDIKSIVCQDGHVINFNYSTTPRADFNGEYALSSVDITYQPTPADVIRPVSEYQLNTSYFIGNRYGTPISDLQKSQARLCLLSVKKIGVDLKEDSPPYIFDYYTGSSGDDIVPPPFFYARDIWGFYNGSNSTKSDNSPISLTTSLAQLDFASLKGLCFQKDGQSAVVLNSKSGYAKNGLLKQIVYPTGGSLKYTYAQNSGTINGAPSSSDVGGVHVSQSSSADGGYSNGCAIPIVTTYNYVMNGVGSSSSLWGIDAPRNSIESDNYYAWEHNTISWSFLNPIPHCTWHYTYPGILSADEAIDLTGMQKFMAAIAPVLGVLSVVTDVLDVINVCLDATPLAIIAVALDVVSAIVSIFIGCDQYTKTTNNILYYNFDLNGSATLPTQFKRVEVIENPGTIGKTVQEFTSSDDYLLWAPTNPVLSAKQRFAPWAYGLPKRITVFDAAGDTIRQTENLYDTTFAQQAILGPFDGSHQIPGPLMSCKCEVILNSSQRNDGWSNQTLYDDPASYIVTSNPGVMNVDLYPMYTGHMELTNTFEREYRVGDASNYVEKATKYTYDLVNYQVNSVTTTQSNGDKTSKFITYSNNGGSGLLSANNILNEPVQTSTSVIHPGSSLYDLPIDDYSYYYAQYGAGQFYITSDKLTQYAQLPNGDVRPSQIQEQRFSVPTDGSNYLNLGGTAAANYKTIQAFTYDGNSNLTGMTDEGGRKVTNIYGYNDKYVIASVVNADPVIDKPAYTSFEDASLGGWTLTGTASYSSTSKTTGARGFNMIGKTLSAPINTAKAYVLTFWANNSGVQISAGATNTKIGTLHNGMRCYEFSIAAGTASVSITGTCTLDELRLYPANAQLHSTTYDPLIGKTSEADVNSRVTSYEYDNLGRMRFVRDEDMNIVKMYEYNNVSAAKQNGCPATYSNNLVTETFTRNNCGAAYQGGTVTYSVPAGKYTSPISQWAADIQAEFELMLNGQTTANSGGSCSLIYYNTAASVTLNTASCDPGYKGGPVTYTVPANTYSSIISQADADQKAADDIAANSDAYVNDPLHAACSIDNSPDWEWQPGDQTTCQAVGSDSREHLFYLGTDQNPNSPTYHQTSWVDGGASTACPLVTYYNIERNQPFTRNNCGAGFTPGTATYTVPANRYSSTVSQEDADQQAINDVNANGQNYANANGSCTPIPVIYARMVIINVHPNPTNFNLRTADVIVRFYQDAAGTVPYTISTTTFNYRMTNTCTNLTSPYTFTANGVSSYTIGTQIFIMADDPSCPPGDKCHPCSFDYFMAAGTGYIVIN